MIKYKNLNKIIKIKHISLKFNRLLFFLLFATVCNAKYRDMLFKKCLIRKDQREFLCAKIRRNSIVNANAFNSEGSLMYYQGRPFNNLFQLFFFTL